MIELHQIIKLVNEEPGLSVREIAYKLDESTRKMSTRLWNLTHSASPRLKQMKLDGSLRFFPLNYKLTSDPVRDKPSILVNIGGEILRVTKASVEELKVIENNVNKGKYADLLEVIDTLNIDEALFIPRNRINRHGLRDVIHRFYKDTKVFTTKSDQIYVTLIRVK